MNDLIYYLIYQFIPYIWIHPQEKYYPTNIETYINQSQLWCNDTLVSDYSGLTSYNLYNISKEYGITPEQIRNRCYLRPTQEMKNGFINNISNAPVYAYYRDFDTFFEIRYLFFYGYNGAYNILHFFNYLDVKYGEHDGDIEHLTLRFSKTNGLLPKQTMSNLECIYYGAHTTHEGVWISPKEVEYVGSHPIAYAALDGHGNYPHAGIYSRIFGFANDYCNRGELWKPDQVVIINDQTANWHSYEGRYTVKNEIATILSKTTADPSEETNSSTDPLKRFFYLYPD
jgi:hypothetical protein